MEWMIETEQEELLHQMIERGEVRFVDPECRAPWYLDPEERCGLPERLHQHLKGEGRHDFYAPQ